MLEGFTHEPRRELAASLDLHRVTVGFSEVGLPDERLDDQMRVSLPHLDVPRAVAHTCFQVFR